MALNYHNGPKGDHDNSDGRKHKPNGEAVPPTPGRSVPLTRQRDITGILVACHLNSTGEMERYNVLGSEQFPFTGRIRFFALESRFCCVVTCCGLAASSGPRTRGTCGSDLWNNRLGVSVSGTRYTRAGYPSDLLHRSNRCPEKCLPLLIGLGIKTSLWEVCHALTK